MSLKLDWDREDEKRRERQQLDEHFLELQEQKKRRVVNAVLGAIGVLVLAGVLILLRQRIFEIQMKNELEQTAIEEARSLRSHNSSAYLYAQENVDGWLALQAALFESYQQEKDRLVPMGEVVDATYVEDQGRVVMRELLDGKPYQVTWFYRRTGEIWLHRPPPLDYWGDRDILNGQHVDVNGYAVDHTQAVSIQTQMETWWQTACQRTACGDGGPPHLTVRLEFGTSLKPRWAEDDPAGIVIPSPHLGRVGEDGSIDPETSLALSRMLAEHWARWVVPVSPDSTATVAWFHEELSTWLAHELGAPETAPLLGPLAERKGPEAVIALAGQLQAGKEVIPALAEVTGADPTTQNFGWGKYLETRLRAETTLVAAGNASAAAELYGDAVRWPDEAALKGVAPGSIRVVEIKTSGDLTWVEISFARTDGDDAPRLNAFVPFRLVGERWVHTTPLAADFGGAQERHSAHITLHVSDLDAPTVEGLAEDLEKDLLTAAGDLGVAPGEIGGLDVTITTSGADDDAWMVITPLAFEPGDGPATLTITVGSPHLTARPASQSARQAMRGLIARDMVIRLIRYNTYTINPRAPLIAAFARWELARLGIDADSYLPVNVPLAGVSVRGLDLLWKRTQGGPFTLEDAIGAEEFIGFIEKDHGPESVSALLRNLADSDDMAGWLKTSVGVNLEDFEPQWAAATQVAISAAK